MDTTKRMKVVIAESMAEDGINMLRFDPMFDIVQLKKEEKDRLKTEVASADALIVRSGVKATKEIIELGKNLKIIARAGAGYDNIDVSACSTKGVVVLTAPTGNTNGVVELTIGLLFSILRNITKADATMKQDKWEKNKLEGREAAGKVLGLIGLGKIGARVAEIAIALGMHIIVLVRNKNKKRDLNFHVDFVDTLDELLPKIDVLSLHVPLNEGTKEMIGKAELEKMKPSAYVINTSRGDVIDEGALYEILKAKRIAGAAIDVYSTEPASLKQYPFIELENVVSMPHLGASTFESQARTSQMICQNLMEALKNDIFIDAVNLPFSIAAEQANNYHPFIVLAKKMSQLLGQWNSKPIKVIDFTHRLSSLHDLKPVILTACAELLKVSFPEVSLININDFLDTHSIGLMIQNSQNLKFENSLKIELEFTDGSIFKLRGIVIADVPKFVEIQDMDFEMIPAGQGIFIENLNVPGVIGAVTSLLGKNKINIADVHLSRSNQPGSHVYQYISVDTELPETVLDAIGNIENIVACKRLTFK